MEERGTAGEMGGEHEKKGKKACSKTTYRTLNASSEMGPSSRVTSGTLFEDAAAAATTRAALPGGVGLRAATALDFKIAIGLLATFATTTTRPRCNCCWGCCCGREVARRRGATRTPREEASACIFFLRKGCSLFGEESQNWVKRHKRKLWMFFSFFLSFF